MAARVGDNARRRCGRSLGSNRQADRARWNCANRHPRDLYFGSQRLWNRHPGLDSSGVSGFFQFGINDSRTLLAHRYFGLGLTGFGLIPGRPADTIGGGLAWSWLNRNFGFRSNETILAAYYQAKIVDGLFLQPVLSYIPNPGATPKHAPAVALTVQTTVLF